MFRQRYGSKYGAKKQEYNGVVYHSKKEAGFAKELNLRKLAGEIKDWERQVRISLDVNDYHIANYYCDFMVHHNDGSKELIEIKSKFTAGFDVYRMKRKLLEAVWLPEHPDTRFTEVI